MENNAAWKLKCSICQEKVICTCTTCNLDLCSSCLNCHQSLAEKHEFKVHQSEYFCFNHLLGFIYYCQDCQCSLCSKCVENHSQHELTTLANHEIESLRNTTKPIIDSYLKESRDVENKLDEKVKCYEEQISNHLNFLKNLQSALFTEIEMGSNTISQNLAQVSRFKLDKEIKKNMSQLQNEIDNINAGIFEMMNS